MIHTMITNTSATIINMKKVKHNNEPSVVNEEVNRMRVMMGLQEQTVKDKLGDFWKNKVKPTAQKVGNAVQTGVHNASQKIADITKKPEQQTIPGKKPEGRDFEQTRSEFAKVNQDMSKKTGFGEAVGQNDNASRTHAMMNAKLVILKKMGATEAVFGFRIIDEAMFQLPNGNKHYMVVIELDPPQQ